MATPKPRVKIPEQANAGEVITIRTLINHDMESGQRIGADGSPVPRRIINRFVCEFNGQTVFACDLEPAVAANPYFEFNARVAESGTFRFTWIDDDGSVYSSEQRIDVR